MKKILILLLVALAITGCGKNTPDSYEDTENRQYSAYYDQFGITDLKNEFYSKPEETYAIYMYGTGCHYCEYCKGAVLDYLDDLKSEKDKKLDNMYIFEREKDTEFRFYFKEKPDTFWFNRDKELYIEKMIGATEITETYFFGTPSLYVIKNHKLSNVLVGDKDVGSYLAKN